MGESAKDVQRIKESFQKIVERMTNSGERHPFPPWNNISRSLNIVGWKSMMAYKGCGEQADVVRRELKAMQYDDQWDFDIVARLQVLPPGAHQFLVGVSKNPSDPDLIIDPWNNKIDVMPHEYVDFVVYGKTTRRFIW
jgi:hypothetical protein